MSTYQISKNCYVSCDCCNVYTSVIIHYKGTEYKFKLDYSEEHEDSLNELETKNETWFSIYNGGLRLKIEDGVLTAEFNICVNHIRFELEL